MPLWWWRQERMILCTVAMSTQRYTAISSISLDLITPTSYCLTSLLLFVTNVLQRTVCICCLQFLCFSLSTICHRHLSMSINRALQNYFNYFIVFHCMYVSYFNWVSIDRLEVVKILLS